jgi:hypothetical protein
MLLILYWCETLSLAVKDAHWASIHKVCVLVKGWNASKLINFHNNECQNLYSYCGRATDRNIIFLSDKQAAFKALNNFQINPTLIWGCHQSPVKLTEHHRVQLLCMLGRMRIDGSEIADNWLEQVPQPHTGPEPLLGICLRAMQCTSWERTARLFTESDDTRCCKNTILTFWRWA